MLPDELVVLGAPTWVGKSEIAYTVAITNALAGKKVLLIALEWDIQEIALRHLQREINAHVINPNDRVRAWTYRFNLDPAIDSVEEYVIEEISQKLKDNLLIFNKTEIPTLSFLREFITLMKDSVDMIVIDHLHYIETEWDSENREVGKIMRELKTITDIIRKPILLISHVRKFVNKSTELTIDDLYGSSNISKEATTILMLSKGDSADFEAKRDKERYWLTVISVFKNRAWILATPTKFKLVYDIRNKEYIEESMEVMEWRGKQPEKINFINKN